MKYKFKPRFWTAIFIFVLFDQGGLYKSTTYFLLFVSLIFLYKKSKMEKRIFIFPKLNTFLTGLIFISSLFSALQGIDKGESFYGVLKLVSIFVVIFSIFQCDEVERFDCLKRLPCLGIIIMLFGALANKISFLKSWVSATGRWAGPFAYPNTLALFLLLGIVILEYFGKKGKRYFQTILCFGILLTGSRAGFLFLCTYLTYIYWKQGRKNKTVILALLGLSSVIFLLTVFGIDLPGISRFLSLNMKASTFQGRLLYWEDAIKMLRSHPLGLGYMGYFYFQQVVQTGVYSVRFVHNDWLQGILDYGVLAGVIMIFFFIKEVLAPNLPKWKKESLIIIGLYSAFDFHLQFWSVLLLVIYIFPMEKKEVAYIQIEKWEGIYLISIFVTIVLSGRFILAEYYANLGNYQSAVKWAPLSTEYRQQMMFHAENLESAEEYANEILEGNLYLYSAYKIKANAAAERGEIFDFLVNENKALALHKYDIEEYEEYFRILLVLYQKLKEENFRVEMQQCIWAMSQIPLQIEEVKRETSIRAYLIQEKPQMQFNREYEKIIYTLKGEMSNE